MLAAVISFANVLPASTTLWALFAQGLFPVFSFLFICLLVLPPKKDLSPSLFILANPLGLMPASMTLEDNLLSDSEN